ncbi:MAG: tetratricopeptide repeat protein [Prevotellaceae bacterium]|jgi:tetratricopeptide (TPR) repeat protein|nr:tetratricopeptide repeat protein [Prevotellaceae bacterium]
MKQKRILLTLLLCLPLQWSAAQAPKWVEKAKRAVFSVITYDEKDQIMNTGNGFFITEDGTALSDYALFKGAQRAVIVNSEGTQMPVSLILGANDMYDVVKFRVDITAKKVHALSVAPAAAAANDAVYLLPYSTQKDRSFTPGTVQATDKMESTYTYYTLNMALKEKMVSCPITNTDGHVIALAQKSSGKDTANICYGVSADYAGKLSISPLSFNDRTLQSIGIKKALPDTEEQAQVYLLMASSALTPDEYAELLDDFIAQYPDNADGYMHRATNRIAMSQEPAAMELAEKDMDKALNAAKKKDDTYFSRAKLIYNYCLGTPATPYGDWSYDRAAEEIRKAIRIDPLPIYIQLEGDILFAKKDYAGALSCYEQVNNSELASAATFFSAAKTKELMEAPVEEVLALMDSCVTRIGRPISEANAPYLLERAQMRMKAKQARGAMLDYDEYYRAVNGKVNDLFYYYREQASLQARQFQRALDDIATAIQMNPEELTYRAELAVINLRVGRYDEAVETLREAIAIDPAYGEAYRLMGIARIQLKQDKEACADFAKAKELGDPHVEELIKKHCQ